MRTAERQDDVTLVHPCVPEHVEGNDAPRDGAIGHPRDGVRRPACSEPVNLVQQVGTGPFEQTDRLSRTVARRARQPLRWRRPRIEALDSDLLGRLALKQGPPPLADITEMT